MFRRMVMVGMVLGTTACATITTGRRETIHVDSKPAGATATLTCENGFVAVETTPATISIARNAGECKVRVAKEGFQEAGVAVAQTFNRAYLLNLWTVVVPAVVFVETWSWGGHSNQGAARATIALGLGSWAVDSFNGAIRRHHPSVINTELQPKVKP